MLTTATTTILNTLLSELQSHLPAQLTTYGLPAVAEWLFGQRELTAITNTPSLQVDIADWEQAGGFGQTTKRDSDLVVLAVISAPDEDTLHRYLIGYADAITGTLESEVTIGGSKLTNFTADFSPSYRRGNALHRGVAVECKLANKLHTRGAI